MKILKRIGMLTLTMLFLTNGLTYAQNSDLRIIYGGKSKNVKTISDYNKAVKKNSKDAKAYYNRGLILVMVDEPKGSCYGGTVAAPIVRNIIKRTLDYHNGIVPEL